MLKEFSESDIIRWAKKSDANAQIYAAYQLATRKANEAFTARDGAAVTGWALRRDLIRDEISKQIFA